MGEREDSWVYFTSILVGFIGGKGGLKPLYINNTFCMNKKNKDVNYTLRNVRKCYNIIAGRLYTMNAGA